MTDAEARSFIAGLTFILAVAIAALAWGQTALNYVIVTGLVFLLWDRANVHEHIALVRRRTMHALATLRRRHDNELLEVWTRVPQPQPYVAEGVWESQEMDDEMNESSRHDVFVPDPEPATDEFPAVQPGELTEPMPLIVDPTPAVQARRDAAWDARRPSPVPRGKSADWVEEAIKRFDFSGRNR